MNDNISNQARQRVESGAVLGAGDRILTRGDSTAGQCSTPVREMTVHEALTNKAERAIAEAAKLIERRDELGKRLGLSAMQMSVSDYRRMFDVDFFPF